MDGPLVDLDLARRLERTEGRGCARCVEALGRLNPGRDVAFAEVAGAYAMGDGSDSPMTQTFGLGMFEDATDAVLDQLEAFYRRRGEPVFHEVSPLAGIETHQRLASRGYRTIELTSVMFRAIAPGLSLGAARSAVRVRSALDSEAGIWAQVAAEGWSEFGDMTALMHEVAAANVERADVHAFFAELHAAPVAAAAMCIAEGVVLLAGASTIPAARCQGAQLALLERRLRDGASLGCDLAMMCAQPGSASQRNAERHGFRIAYTRIKWGLGSV